MRRADDAPPPRTGLGCLVTAVMLFLELSLGLGIAVSIGEALAPSLAARGYNPKVGGGYMIGFTLGAIVAIYPVIWLDRLRRRLGG